MLSIDLFSIIDYEGRFIKLNPAWEKTLGYRADELISKPWLQFIHPDDLEATVAATVGLSEKTVTQLRSRFRHKNGAYLWL